MALETFVLLILINTNVLDPGTYRFRADDREVGQTVVEGKSDKIFEVRIDVPAGTKKLVVERVKAGPSRDVTGSDSYAYDVISVASITKSVREERPVVALEQLSSHVDAVLKEMGVKHTAEELGLEFGPPQSIEALKHAEETLGFSLDPELVAVLTKLGPLRFGDNGMTEARKFLRTDEQFESIWGSPETVQEEDTRDLYRNSTMVWVEAGDGYGAVLYAPERAGPMPLSAGYWKIHQETIGDPMPYATSAQGGPLSSALMACVIEDLLIQIEDQGLPSQLLVDPSMPEPFPVWLFNDNDGTLRLRPDWSRHY